MKLLQLPDNVGWRRLVFWLAMEEWAVEHAPGSFFVWNVKPTVIFGRNQDMEAEVNIPYCLEHGIEMYRRKSGGGCVYADEGNLMVSFISPNVHSQEVFDWFLEKLSCALRTMGYDAVTTAHNDVLVADRKVAGTACYTTSTGTVVHACILYDVNLDHLQQAITPSSEKMAKHGVASVRQRVRNLRDIKDLGPIAVFRQRMEEQIERCLAQ